MTSSIRSASSPLSYSREIYKEETKNFLLNFKNRSNELKLNQDHIDKLLNDEMERQWKKRQDQWDKEMNARINLMTDVYHNRADAVHYKKETAAEELRRKEREKQQVTEELEQIKKQDTRAELEEYLVGHWLPKENEAAPEHHPLANQRKE